MPDPHLCHADGCTTRVPRRMFMCRTHWFMVPLTMRDQLMLAYTPGQERLDGTAWPSDEYLDIAMACVEAVAVKEGHRATTKTTNAQAGATGEGS